MRKQLNFKKLYAVLKEKQWTRAKLCYVDKDLDLTECYGIVTMPLIEYMPICVRYENDQQIAIIYNNNYNAPHRKNIPRFAFILPTWRYHQIAEYIEEHKDELFQDEEVRYFESVYNENRACV